VLGIKVFVYEISRGLVEVMAIGTAVRKLAGVRTQMEQLIPQAIIRDRDTFFDESGHMLPGLRERSLARQGCSAPHVIRDGLGGDSIGWFVPWMATTRRLPYKALVENSRGVRRPHVTRLTTHIIWRCIMRKSAGLWLSGFLASLVYCAAVQAQAPTKP